MLNRTGFGLISSASKDSVDECVSLCAATAGCELWSFNLVSFECDLRFAEGESAQDAHFVSGPRNCPTTRSTCDSQKLSETR